MGLLFYFSLRLLEELSQAKFIRTYVKVYFLAHNSYQTCIQIVFDLSWGNDSFTLFKKYNGVTTTSKLLIYIPIIFIETYLRVFLRYPRIIQLFVFQFQDRRNLFCSIYALVGGWLLLSASTAKNSEVLLPF